MKELTRIETSSLFGGISARRCRRIGNRADFAYINGNERRHERLAQKFARLCRG